MLLGQEQAIQEILYKQYRISRVKIDFARRKVQTSLMILSSCTLAWFMSEIISVMGKYPLKILKLYSLQSFIHTLKRTKNSTVLKDLGCVCGGMCCKAVL